jgi:hypothetical protein
VARLGSGSGVIGSSAADLGDDSLRLGSQGRSADRTVFRLALGLVLAPLAISAIALVVRVGGDYRPYADYAWTELQVRDVGRHEVLVGLYSRDGWSHPGPLLFYVLAPFYRLTGGASIGLGIGALAINGAAITGMAFVARRRAGTPLALCTLLACALVLRTLGAQFAHDPWNLFVTVLPFGLMIFLTWAMSCGESWALPVGVVVTSFLAQTHVGYVVLAVPLLVWGAGGLWLSARSDREPGRRRGLLRSAVVAAGLGIILWIPTVLDVLLHEGSNARRIVDWFTHSDLAAHSLIDGSKVVLGQFGLPPEWLTSKRLATVWGESAFLYASPPPVLLVPVALAAWTLWRRCRPDGPRLVLTLGLALLVSVGAVARTPGPVLDYRLRSTWMPAMVAFVVTAWAGWAVIAGRSPRAERRWLVPGALVALAGLGVLNTATVAVDVPHEGGSAAVRSLTSQLGEALADDDDLARRDGAVVVTRPPGQADWITAALVLQLERQGIDARVPTADASAVGRHRVLTDGPVKARLVVVTDQAVTRAAAQPGRRLVAWWTSDQLERDVSGPRRDRSDGPSAAGGGGHEWLAEQFSDEALRRRVAEDDVPSVLMLFAGDAPPAHQIAVFLEEP